MRQAAFDGGLDQIGCEKSQREGRSCALSSKRCAAVHRVDDVQCSLNIFQHLLPSLARNFCVFRGMSILLGLLLGLRFHPQYSWEGQVGAANERSACRDGHGQWSACRDGNGQLTANEGNARRGAYR